MQTAEYFWLAPLLQGTGASAVISMEKVQSLWKGFGQIWRVWLKDGCVPRVIVKAIAPFAPSNDISLQRKQKSYQVERAWYRHYSTRLPPDCRVPLCWAQGSSTSGDWLILEDLDSAGYPERKRKLTESEIQAVLHWLARFHARFLGMHAPELWEEGSYWHLATRPEEWRALPEGPLKAHASQWAQQLQSARFQTLIHGDAKPANFCFGPGPEVAAVDFQYVGRGCGMKDVAYLLSAVIAETQAAQELPAYLERYFEYLSLALAGNPLAADIEAEWRALFEIAWLDFYRFELGWMGGDPKHYPFSEAVLKSVLQAI